jgi:DNA-binding transcriptional ArsR family regulator
MRRVVEVTDARSLRALAHPIRLRLLGLLRTHGPLTATEAGDLLGESPASASFHLRQLAAHGLVEEAGRQGRRRPWRATAMITSVPPTLADSDAAEAAALFGQVVVDHYISLFRGWVARRSALPEAWHEAAGLNDRLTYLTPDELRRTRQVIDDMLTPYEERLADPSRRPEGSRLVSLVYAGIPLPEDHV